MFYKMTLERKVRTEKYPHFLLRNTIKQRKYYYNLKVKYGIEGTVFKIHYGLMEKQLIDLELGFNS